MSESWYEVKRKQHYNRYQDLMQQGDAKQALKELREANNYKAMDEASGKKLEQ